MRRVVLLALLSVWVCACDDTHVAVCVGDVQFCNNVVAPVADAGPDQTTVAGDVVVLDGSDSSGGAGSIHSYSWAQTGGRSVALVDANAAKASFVAPAVVAVEVLTFRLTVVDGANVADSNSTSVTVKPAAAAAVAVALQLFDGPLRPPVPWPPGDIAGCPSATDELPPHEAAAQLGLWLAGRTLLIVKGLDQSDPSVWLDLVRVAVAERPAAPQNIAGQLESLGFMLFGSALTDRDPALRQNVRDWLRGAPSLDDPAALLANRTQVRTDNDITIEPAPDPTEVVRAAAHRLLAARSVCIPRAEALRLTAAGLAVIAAADVEGD